MCGWKRREKREKQKKLCRPPLAWGQLTGTTHNMCAVNHFMNHVGKSECAKSENVREGKRRLEGVLWGREEMKRHLGENLGESGNNVHCATVWFGRKRKLNTSENVKQREELKNANRCEGDRLKCGGVRSFSLPSWLLFSITPSVLRKKSVKYERMEKLLWKSRSRLIWELRVVSEDVRRETFVETSRGRK